MSQAIQDKVALVTGANRGIGKSYVEVFLEEGAAKVYAAARNPESIQPLIDQYGDRVVPLELDLSVPETVERGAAAASDVDLVINNGGVLTTTGPLDDSVYDSLEYELDVNLRGLIRMARAFIPVLQENGGGVFGQLNSVVSLKAFSSFSTYSVSKAATYSYTQSLREALQGTGIHVVSIHPGPIATDMGSSAGLEDVAEPPRLVPEATRAAFEAGAFHAFPDTMAKQIGEAYGSFAENVVEADLMEG